MTENTGESTQQEGGATLTIRAQYVSNLSFESPNPIKSFTENTEMQPNISVNVQARANSLGNSNFEVILDLHAEAKRENDVLFIAELSYAGIISVGQVPEDQVAPLVMIESPHLLFPFARNILADMTREGGFPPLYLSPIDFAGLYLNQQKADAAAAQGAAMTQV